MNPIKDFMNSVNGVKESLDGVKQSMNEMKATVGSATDGMQETVEQAKEKTNELKESISRIKVTVNDTKPVVVEAAQTLKGERTLTLEQPAPKQPEMHKEGDRYQLRDEDKLIGEVTCLNLRGTGTWVLDYAYIMPEYRGRGLAKFLLNWVVEDARHQGAKVLPACSYALSEFRKSPEYADVWQR